MFQVDSWSDSRATSSRVQDEPVNLGKNLVGFAISMLPKTLCLQTVDIIQCSNIF